MTKPKPADPCASSQTTEEEPMISMRLTEWLDTKSNADLAVRHALKIMQLAALLREARNSRAVDFVPNDWAVRVDEALKP